MMIFSIDPGNERSAYSLLDSNLSPVKFGILPNDELLNVIDFIATIKDIHFCCEMVASYGMAVGKTVFDTCIWIGRFSQLIFEHTGSTPTYIYRMDEKMALCHDSRAKDGNIRQALIDRFGPVGTKKNKGWFYGVSKDVWAAIAVGVTYHDKYLS
jgi:hypothetical protein